MKPIHNPFYVSQRTFRNMGRNIFIRAYILGLIYRVTIVLGVEYGFKALLGIKGLEKI